MASAPWLTIVGLGEDGADGLSSAALAAIAAADVVTGASRHLALLPGLTAEAMEWPVPFADGIPRLLALRGRRVVMLASGDPFWFGAGTSVTRHLELGEWWALPAPSTFGLAAARLGWALETTVCLGLHAAPLARLRPHLAPGVRALLLLRDGAAVAELAAWLRDAGFGATAMTVLESLGGPRERVRRTSAAGFDLTDVAHPVAVGLEPAGDGAVITAAAGRADALFDHDGQITKRPVRALTLSALAPRPGERLWDIGAGSGSVSIEWLLAHPTTQATAVEADPARAARIRANADRLGADRLQLVQGRALDVLEGLPPPDAVFVGGGLSEALLTALWERLPAGCRVVANAVTLESEALLASWHDRVGGSLLRIELAEASPLGGRRGWKSAYPVVQWSVVR
ncbi:precorrin-6y C5,15-methyltransferase (decarboxylating) subunit CbiE [Azospirillum sp. RWY-5-1]|uniref:Precorrin-6y C5,15-methyltransferase (Decarboxylating) subunit CbiE n=1 Tax=Azospirillum oleiclasticum TaxID=2735135 RepID=A0ABX2TB48_9PROT|nr:precorrin-6y C5,15-methyltransferase (decarboxylating) subunit CbiE [Azospirillum oleiclasticum]NYZ15173.1 precorrin-6y C5,15-methyltransferase (decarboxylating) subunit CbiE [Azospirillum oleiclasticum]NYZ21406.1 precorrin-6y C5,15-methyltransferase (decarboxylating) subunit CbiE [Azospirillum oleiclasticum]